MCDYFFHRYFCHCHYHRFIHSFYCYAIRFFLAKRNVFSPRSSFNLQQTSTNYIDRIIRLFEYLNTGLYTSEPDLMRLRDMLTFDDIRRFKVGC